MVPDGDKKVRSRSVDNAIVQNRIAGGCIVQNIIVQNRNVLEMMWYEDRVVEDAKAGD